MIVQNYLKTNAVTNVPMGDPFIMSFFKDAPANAGDIIYNDTIEVVLDTWVYRSYQLAPGTYIVQNTIDNVSMYVSITGNPTFDDYYAYSYAGDWCQVVVTDTLYIGLYLETNMTTYVLTEPPVSIEENIAITNGQWLYRTFTLPAGTYTVTMSGPIGVDVDLYTSITQQPTSSIYDCRPYSGSSNEQCYIELISGGTIYVGMRAYDTTTISLKINQATVSGLPEDTIIIMEGIPTPDTLLYPLRYPFEEVLSESNIIMGANDTIERSIELDVGTYYIEPIILGSSGNVCSYSTITIFTNDVPTKTKRLYQYNNYSEKFTLIVDSITTIHFSIACTSYCDSFPDIVKDDEPWIVSYKILSNKFASYPMNCIVNWGDGEIDHIKNANDPRWMHTYIDNGTYDISVIGEILAPQFERTTNRGTSDYIDLNEIKQWGEVINQSDWSYAFNTWYGFDITDPIIFGSNITNMRGMFAGCQFVTAPLIGNWDISNVTDISYMFTRCTGINQPLNDWDTSKIENMKCAFSNCTNFNHPLDNWDTTNVISMSHMFNFARPFNQSLNTWDTRNVTDMHGMFSDCYVFNQPIDNWDTRNVTDMSYMLSGATAFNSAIFNKITDCAKVVDMRCMFNYTTTFNQPVNNWNVSTVINMGNMFRDAWKFNQPLNNWNVSNVVDMTYMLCATDFNYPVDSWDTSRVTNMKGMFSGCSEFNQPLITWDTSNVTDMSYMFKYASLFNQSLATWDTSNVTNMSYMLAGAHAFNSPMFTNVENVSDMSYMFLSAYYFNQSLNAWNTNKVTNMSHMFACDEYNDGEFEITRFNSPIFNDVINVTDMSWMFHKCRFFNQPIGNWNVANVTNMDSMFFHIEYNFANSLFNQDLSCWDVSKNPTHNGFANNSPFDTYPNHLPRWGLAPNIGCV